MAKTNTQFIRDRVEGCLPKRVAPLESLRSSEWSREFEELMRNRLLMGAFRYGLLIEKHRGQKRFDLLGSIATSKLET